MFVCVLASGCAPSESAVLPTLPVTTTPVPTTTVALPTTSAAPTTTTTTDPPDLLPPSIATDPDYGETVDWFRGDFTVMTEPGSTLAINGEPVDTLRDGTYVHQTTNSPGDNLIDVTSEDEAGNIARKRIRYTFAPRDGWVAAIGDSVMLGSKIEIEKRLADGIVDATVSRQFLHAPSLVAGMMARSDPPEVIVIGLGTDGPVQERHFDEVMDNAGPEPLVVFVNVRVPRSWEAESNARLSEGVERYDNAVLVDWYTPTRDRDDLFTRGGFHPRPQGRVMMAELIAAAISPDREPPIAE